MKPPQLFLIALMLPVKAHPTKVGLSPPPENPTNPNNIERWQYDKVIKSAKETLGWGRGPEDIVINENGVIKTKNWKR